MGYTVHGVAKSRTQLSDFHFHFSFPYGPLLGRSSVTAVSHVKQLSV